MGKKLSKRNYKDELMRLEKIGLKINNLDDNIITDLYSIYGYLNLSEGVDPQWLITIKKLIEQLRK